MAISTTMLSLCTRQNDTQHDNMYNVNQYYDTQHLYPAEWSLNYDTQYIIFITQDAANFLYIMLSVIILSVIMLRVVAQKAWQRKEKI